MKRNVLIATIITLILIIFINYTDIAVFIISSIQNKESVTVLKMDGIEPKDRIADISITALDSIVTSRLGDKKYRFVSLDVEEMNNLTGSEVQYMLTYFKQYSDRVIYASQEVLIRVGLCTPLTKDLRGGILLSIDDIVELTNERAVLKISAHESGLGAAGYICTLMHKEGKWEVEELLLKYMA